MARPLLCMAIFLIMGILFGFWGIALSILLMVSCLLAVLHYIIYNRKVSIILPFFALLGSILIYNATNPSDNIVESYMQNEYFVRIEGIVHDISYTRSERQRIRLSTSSFTTINNDVHYSNINIMVNLPDGVYAALGQRLSVYGFLNGLEPARNPGGFSQLQFLRSRGIEYTMFAERVTLYEVNFLLIGFVRNFGVRLANVFHELLPQNFAAIMQAMIVGDRTGLDQETLRLFRQVGIFHILVVSGLHVTILSLSFEKVLNFTKLKPSMVAICTILFIIAYAVLTGAGVATVRASIMGICLILTKLKGYENDTVSALSLAAIILLVSSPLNIFDIGFIYSFSMVLGLIYGSKPIADVMHMLSKRYDILYPILNFYYIKKYFPGCLAAFLVYIPINSFFFYQFSPVSLLVNFLLLPSVFLLITSGFLMAIVGQFSLMLASLIATPIYIMLSLYFFVMNTAASLPFSLIITGRPHTFVLAFIFLILSVIYYLIRNKKANKQYVLAICLTTIIGYTFLSFLNIRNPYINITFLDVGQGKSTVISRNSSGIIFDGGGVFGRDIGENVGTFTLIPYLNYRGIKQALAIASHNSSDHVVGIIEALQQNRISHLFINKATSNQDVYLYNMMVNLAKNTNTPVSYLAAGDIIDFFGARLYILYPRAKMPFPDENNSSMSMRFVYENTSVLFMSDIQRHGERLMLSQGINVSADILQVGHQGSRLSTTDEFLRAVNPNIAIISAGRNNIYGHPHQSTIDTLNNQNVKYFITARDGAIKLKTNGQILSIKSMIN